MNPLSSTFGRSRLETTYRRNHDASAQLEEGVPDVGIADAAGITLQQVAEIVEQERALDAEFFAVSGG